MWTPWHRKPSYVNLQKKVKPALQFDMSQVHAQQNMSEEDENLLAAIEHGHFKGVRSFVSRGADIDYEDYLDGCTPAMKCCQTGSSKILQFLLDQGANAELSSSYEYTSLMYTASCNKYECAAVLVRHGVVLDAITSDGETALWLASRGGYLQIVQLLVQGGADIDRASNDGNTPIAIARVYNHTAVVTYLSIEGNWRRRRNYATVLNSLKEAPTNSKMMRVFQCYDVARVIGSYL